MVFLFWVISWWRRNWAELEKGRKKEPEKGRKKEKTEREREREKPKRKKKKKVGELSTHMGPVEVKNLQSYH